ncbi:dihydrolipoyl dehydrogenase [Rhodospirillum rubrum]|uniref:Dihydrolipoyl dehydrogenase n=1 Tax=Rhodospirillum rubrum (strain ATCC 11170 / ATH 1.1.1 / DSM 467 / LMG 4362 / NCIMB 8255 / S1) TaxID=269796 RepID=Q2RV29_RHORT|nr:dihydrolipoyl dehydrogenase [Rhodospirillum rubrum]ABC22016.1 dihydrolipoamide dehydrogenase [Rhodospirillum rubrum ATCC 11170]AEO47728.1 dihydrolipoamide dehydrogenase [Rhodospirillum rubrum F11]MBK5953598.1 dihydrolipoyl dehydrogenase [Rhodospirillum rubrum]QXG81671.1 dihydrolipoyl dehydrogenase [Rhodospirillum rubrum]HAQ00532.1 dihydrolipoyl dehydrogenase [Rhodospirillum rubrum]
MSDFDVVVIGGGPGGYVCAIRAAQLGLRVACVEKRPTLGGTCLNVGCIPSKALLQSSHLFDEANHGFAAHGITVGTLGLDMKTMMARKDEVVEANTKGIVFLFKKNKVTHVVGSARIAGAGQVVVSGEGGEQTLTTRAIVIATGSEVTPLPGVTIDEERIVSSTGALALAKVPKSLVVIGAGVIGLELGSVWRRLGAEVTVVEYLDHILPPMDGEVRKQSQRILEKQGLRFKLGRKVTAAERKGEGVSLTVEPAKGGEAETLEAETVLVAVGRRPFTDGLGLEEVGVEKTDRGFVKVDGDFQTAIEGIFAIGDVIGGMMLAHKAEDEGMALAEMLAGESAHVNYGAIPSVVYTWPEIAGVGKTEEMLKKDGVAYKVGKFPFTANARAKANGDTDGFVKILSNAETGRVLGCHIIGAQAGDLIMEVVLGMEFGASSEDIARTCHAHPQLGEAVKEAALAVNKRTIHM